MSNKGEDAQIRDMLIVSFCRSGIEGRDYFFSFNVDLVKGYEEVFSKRKRLFCWFPCISCFYKRIWAPVKQPSLDLWSVVLIFKTNLDVYLEEGLFICEEGSDMKFDALKLWKVNNLKYHIFSKMRWGILTSTITTVALESTFSAVGRVIDPYQASLSKESINCCYVGLIGWWHFIDLRKHQR